MMVFEDEQGKMSASLRHCRGLHRDYFRQNDVTKFRGDFNIQQFENVIQNNLTEVRENFNGMAVPDFARRVLDQFREKGNRKIFLTLPPGHAIIDPGAGQALILLAVKQEQGNHGK